MWKEIQGCVFFFFSWACYLGFFSWASRIILSLGFILQFCLFLLPSVKPISSSHSPMQESSVAFREQLAGKLLWGAESGPPCSIPSLKHPANFQQRLFPFPNPLAEALGCPMSAKTFPLLQTPCLGAGDKCHCVLLSFFFPLKSFSSSFLFLQSSLLLPPVSLAPARSPGPAGACAPLQPLLLATVLPPDKWDTKKYSRFTPPLPCKLTFL